MIETRDDLREYLASIKIKRARVVEVRDARLLILFVREKDQQPLFDLLDAELTEKLGFAIGSLLWHECRFRRFQYHLI